MKTFTKAVVLFGFTLAFTSGTSFAQFTIDEFGGPLTSFPSILGPDPSGGVAGPVLIYTLPFAVTPGDLILTEPGQPAGGPGSDIIRFWNSTAAGQSEIIFYSDFSAVDPADAPADVGLPAQLQLLSIIMPEVGPEGNNGVLYLANPGMPGAPTTGVAVQYTINSDTTVPEPGSMTLLLGGLGVLFGIKRLRR